jgi:hypothetical protein
MELKKPGCLLFGRADKGFDRAPYSVKVAVYSGNLGETRTIWPQKEDKNKRVGNLSWPECCLNAFVQIYINLDCYVTLYDDFKKNLKFEKKPDYVPSHSQPGYK